MLNNPTVLLELLIESPAEPVFNCKYVLLQIAAAVEDIDAFPAITTPPFAVTLPVSYTHLRAHET